MKINPSARLGILFRVHMTNCNRDISDTKLAWEGLKGVVTLPHRPSSHHVEYPFSSGNSLPAAVDTIYVSVIR